YVGQLWRIPAQGAPRRLTRGFRDTSPKFSPDGSLIGFLRATPDGSAQLAVMPADGGEPMVVTDRKMGVSDFCFTPDGSRVVFSSAVPEEGRYGTLAGVDAAAEDPRRIDTLSFQYNGRGYLADQRMQVFVVELPDPSDEPPVKAIGRAAKAAADESLLPVARQLTDADADHAQPVVWGEYVIVVSARHAGHDSDLRHDLYRIPLAGGEAVNLTDLSPRTTLDCSSPVVVGDFVYFVAHDLGASGRDFVGANGAVYRVQAEGGEAERLSDPTELDIASISEYSADALLGVLLERGTGVPLRISPTGELSRLAVPAGASVQGIAAGAGQIWASVSTLDSPGEIALLGADPAIRTDFAAALHGACDVVLPQEVVSTSPDGARIQGWVFLPSGPGPHPVLLNIHGGPFAAYGPAYFDEAQVYANAGYAVVMCNPRGSASYGEAFGKAIQGAFGDRDALDVLCFLDHALATFPELDAGQLGVMGGSYGGYLSAWIIAHDHRFKAAIVERAYLDPRSFIGSSDIGWFFAYAYNTDDPATMDAQSPLLLATQVRTPTLVLHSENDLRCPLSQALRYYTELKLAGTEAELLVFPGETHELSRSGRPIHRRQRFEAILQWWSHHLGKES
ncbi:MAG: S9 family peptidase, partial [Propionibacteriaceae bacterium]|nr:S9 family peptidase [Propionibacteriaceae bacterium]